MTPDIPVRSKQMELFSKLHLGMDHVLAKLLLDAPPLPDALKLQTETQSLATTWVQVSAAYEKRKAMLQRRKDKSKSKAKRQEENLIIHDEKKGEEKDTITRPKSESRSSNAFPRNGKGKFIVKAKEKAWNKKKDSHKVETGGREDKGESKPSVYDQKVLKKLRELPMCQDVAFGSKKYRALVKWMEMDKGKDAGTSADLMKLLTKLRLDVAPKGRSVAGKPSRKRSLEAISHTPRSDKYGKSKSLAGEQGQKKRVSEKSSDDVEFEYRKEELKSNEVEVVPEQDTRVLLERNKERGKEKVLERKTEEAREAKRDKAARRADDVVTKEVQPNGLQASTSVETTASSKVENEKPGASSKSAIVLDDSDEEEEEESGDQDSSTDEDQDLFDLNEEDVYVVETILCVKEGRTLLSGGRREKETDLYLVKWDGYNELTWEPEEHIPRRLIEMFREREQAKRACQYQIKVAHERREVMNVTTQHADVIYMVQWMNQELPVWESRSTLPIKTQVWLDKVLGAPITKKRRETKVMK